MSIASVQLRDYQQRLFDVCANKNSILYLPTGSGKTLIAVKVIEHFAHDLKISLDDGGKRSLFLVNTVVLGQQVAAEIQRLLGLKVACWNSETHKKSWSKQRYYDQFNEHEVFVATAQLFLDAVKHSFISIEQINVIVFDESHHARMNHPYHELMKQFKYIHPSKQPRVIGLSGMLIGISSSITVESVEEELKALESTLLSTIVTVNKMQELQNVLLYSTNPKESSLRYDPTPKCDLVSDLIERVGEIRFELSLIEIKDMTTINPQTLRKAKQPNKLKELSLLFEDFKFELEEMGVYGGFLSLQAVRVQFELVKKQPNQHKEILKTVKLCLEYVKELLEMIAKDIDLNNATAEQIVLNSSLKVRTLIGLLKLKFVKPDMQSLVFVKRRFTAKTLYHLLKRYSDLNPTFPVIPDFVVGINSELPESIDEVLSMNSNKFAIENFRQKKTNLICTSSVLEEGMDLQMCNLVIMYDFPTTYRSYIQTKGRARTTQSDYVVLLPRSNAVFIHQRDTYDKIDIKTKNILMGKTCDRELCLDAIEKEREEQWEPFITEENAQVNNISAVALLNRYVSRFANANVLFERKDLGPGRIKAIVTLPPQSQIKEAIESDVFDDIKLAKQNAAFKACARLHEIGQLDQNLLPKYY